MIEAISGLMTFSDTTKIEIKTAAKCLAIGALFIATMKTLAYLTNKNPSDSSTKSYWDDRDDDTTPTRYEPARNPIVDTKTEETPKDVTTQPNNAAPIADTAAPTAENVTLPTNNFASTADKTESVADASIPTEETKSSWTDYFSWAYDVSERLTGPSYAEPVTDISDWSVAPK